MQLNGYFLNDMVRVILEENDYPAIDMAVPILCGFIQCKTENKNSQKN